MPLLVTQRTSRSCVAAFDHQKLYGTFLYDQYIPLDMSKFRDPFTNGSNVDPEEDSQDKKHVDEGNWMAIVCLY